MAGEKLREKSTVFPKRGGTEKWTGKKGGRGSDYPLGKEMGEEGES